MVPYLRGLYIFLVFFSFAYGIFASSIMKIQQVRSLEYPYIKAEILVSNITPIQGITASDIEVYENDWRVVSFQLQPILNTKETKHIALLIDSSRSIKAEIFKQQLKAAHSFVDTLNDKDYVSILTFNDMVVNHCGYTKAEGRLGKCIDSLRQAGKKTVLYDSILQGLHLVSRDKMTRSSIVVMTDGTDEGSVVTLHDIIDKVNHFSVPVFVLGTGTQKKLKPLSRLSRLSGGRTFVVANLENLNRVSKLLNQWFQSTYLIQYLSQAAHTATDGRRTELKIKVNAKKGRNEITDEDTYTFFVPGGVSVYWWQRLWHDQRYFLFIVGLIIVLLLFVIIILVLRKPKPIALTSVEEASATVEQPHKIEEYITGIDTQPIKQKAAIGFAPKKEIKDQAQMPLEYYLAYLVEKEGPETGKKHKLYWTNVTIGHGDENSIVIDDPTVSIKHAQIIRRQRRFVLYDLLSEHGVYLNGKKLIRPKELNDFDEIQLGRTRLIFREAGGRD